MPNKRDKSKAAVLFYIDKNVKRIAKEILEKKGLTLTEYLNVSIYELLDKRENEILQILGEFDARTKAGRARSRAKKNTGR